MKSIKKKNLVFFLIILCMAIITLIHVCTNSFQAMTAIPMKLELLGEYRINEGAWNALTDDVEFSTYDGDLWLRGNFGIEMSEEFQMHFYMNHIGVEIYVNGECIYDSELIKMYNNYKYVLKSMCGEYWETVLLPAIQETDVVEIHLTNIHSFGNKSAYNEYIDSMYTAGDYFYDYMQKEEQVERSIGIGIMVISLLILGVALVSFYMRVSLSSLLLYFGLFVFFAAGFLILDLKTLSMINNLIVFNTYAKFMCIMFSMLMLGLCIVEVLKGKAQKVGQVMIGMSGVAGTIFILMSYVQEILLFDMLKYWYMLQWIIVPVLLLCIIKGWNEAVNYEKKILLAIGILYLTAMLEFINIYLMIWQSGLMAKMIFVILFVVALFFILKIVPANYRATVRAKELEKELKNSRVVLAMSQIRTHFIFNVLNAISGMCKYNPQEADDTIVRFARYLRHNIDIMQEDLPISFSNVLTYLEDYIALEQIRFGEKIKFKKDIKFKDFMLPPLVLQPIVENAIKHGLIPKAEGGTISLCTYREGENVIISISDDGVGYDIEKEERKGAIGMSNVRFRVEHMVQGKVIIHSKPNEGTVITLIIPYKEKLDERNICR